MLDDDDKKILISLKNRINILNKHLILNNNEMKKIKIPKANLLIQEAVNNQDMDGNDLIYGYDFLIEMDENIPLIIKIYQENNLKDITNKPFIKWNEVRD